MSCPADVPRGNPPATTCTRIGVERTVILRRS
jgi:hypothetical protein